MKKHHARGMAGEIAEASRAPRPTTHRAYPNELVATARTLERLLHQRRKIRRDLRRVDALIKHERKMLRALAGAERGEI